MNFCIAGYSRIKSSPNNAICFITTNFINFLEAIEYFLLSVGAIVLFEVFTLAGSQNPTNFYTGSLRPEVQPLPFCTPFFSKKVALSYNFFDKWYPFHIPW